MKKLFIIFISLLTIIEFSCSDEESNVQSYISTTVKITVNDVLGNDLFDSNTSNYIHPENIKIYHKIKEEFVEYFEGNLDYPKGYRIYNPYDLGVNSKYIFCLLATSPEKSNDLSPITYIKWTELDMDTLQCQYSKTENSIICMKVWYNNEKVWDMDEAENNETRLFQIVK